MPANPKTRRRQVRSAGSRTLRVESLGAPRRRVHPRDVQIMLAESREQRSRGGMGLRAQVRRLPVARRARERASRCSSIATAATSRRRFPRSRAPSLRCRSTGDGRRGRGARRAWPAELPAPAEARADAPRRRHRARRRRDSRYGSSCSTCSASKAYDLRPLPLLDAQAAAAATAASGRAAALRRPRRRTRRGAVRRHREDGARRHGRQAKAFAVPRRALRAIG